MTLFEYLAIVSSLVFSFAAVRLVGGLPAALVWRSDQKAQNPSASWARPSRASACMRASPSPAWHSPRWSC